MKCCFSISTYDAIVDLHIAAEVIKSNWNYSNDLFLVAGLCKPGTMGSIDRDLFNHILEIDTPQSPSVSIGDKSVAASSRLFNSMINTGRLAILNHCDYIIYLNSGSWILDINRIIKIIHELGDRVVAAQMAQRAQWVVVDDHFLIINLKKANQLGLYADVIDYKSRFFNPLTTTSNGIHGMLINWFSLVPYGDVYVYSSHENSINEFGKNKIFSLIPLTFNPSYQLLHSNAQFPYLHFLRGKFLEKYVNCKSRYIRNYLSEHSTPPKQYIYCNDPFPFYRKKFLTAVKDRMIQLRKLLPLMIKIFLKDFYHIRVEPLQLMSLQDKENYK